MSIYVTKRVLKVETSRDEFVTVFVHAVPAHVGHGSEGDPYKEFLPPVSDDYDPETRQGTDRAVVFVAKGRDRKKGQRYLDPLLVLSGPEYAAASFEGLMQRVVDAVVGPRR